jgi:hypothetical protein
MACLYTHNGKTYSKEELIEYLKNNPKSNTYEVKPDFSNIDEIIAQIAEEPESTEKKELSNRVITRLNKLLKEQGDKIKARILVFESAKERKGYLPKEETINKLKDLKEQLSTLENTEAFFKTAEFIHHELAVTQQFLDNKFDITNHDHINYLLQISNQLDSYSDLRTFLPQMSGLNSDIAKIGSEIDSMYADINDEINEILQTYMVDFVKSNSKRNLTEEDIQDMLNQAKDISIQELKMGGMSNSVSPLLQLLQKEVEKTREAVYENTNNWVERITTAGEKLKKAGVEGFDWMYQKTKDGKLTGRLLQKVSQSYYEAEKKIYELLEDSEGNKREYIYKPGETLSQAEKDHNIALSRDKAKLGEFLNAETTGEQGLQDGENRKYTDEFKQARNEFEYYGMGEKGYNEWLKKPFIPGSKLSTGEELTSAMHEKLYKQYKRKYYQDERESFSMVKDQLGRPTGVVKRTLVTFVKPEFTEVVTERNGKPTKFGNPEYYKVMTDQTPQGKAKREYFEFVLKANQEILDKLPLSVKQKMQGKMFRVGGNLVKDIKKLGLVNGVVKGFRQFVNPDVVFSSRELDENGQLLADVPIMYTTDLKNTEKLKKLEAKLKSLQEALLKDPSNKELHSKIKIAKNVILIEENKLTPEELELDMTKSLIKAAHMAENYDLMKQTESTLMIARKIMKNTKFFKLDSAGQKEFLHENEKSKTEERFDTYMRMIFYSNSTANQTKVAKMLQNFNTFVAYKSLGLNPFSAINNTIMANINNRIEGFGKQFGFDNTHLNKAIADTTQQVASMNFMKHVGKDPHTIKPTNKFEAMLEKFNWIDRNQIIEDHSVLSTIMFGGITAGEFIAQSNTAIAKLRSQILTNSKTGEKLSIWEAHEFINGKLQLKDGFTYEALDRRKLSVEIKNMNKIIHGNYSEGDKVALQEFALGQTAMQFKKWMYNFGKSRYGATYFDETTGDYQEGRYRTFANFISVIKAGGMYDFNSIRQAFNSLADYQKSNLKKLQVEGIYWMTTAVLMLMLEALAKGVDDDDEELKMFVNFLRKQSDRVGGELDAAINPKSIYSNLKNPVSGLRTANDFGELMVQLVKTPTNLAFGDTKDIYITKGSNKGMTKLGKEFRDVIPVANLEAQFDNLMNSGNFYFK